MEKFSKILTVAVYFCLTVGLPVLLHTCGEFSSASFASEAPVDPCGPGCSDDCCDLIVKLFHIEDSQITPVQETGNSITAVVSLLSPVSVENLNTGHSNLISSADNSPPGTVPLHLLDCALLI